MSATRESMQIIARLKNLSTIIDGYSQLGFEFEYYDEIKNAIKSKIQTLVKKDAPPTSTNNVEVLRAVLYEFPEIEFNDEERQEIFDQLLQGFIVFISYDNTSGKAKNLNLPVAGSYFSRFIDLIETLDYLFNSVSQDQVEKLCKAIDAAKIKAEADVTTASNEIKKDINAIVIPQLDTLRAKFNCP